MESERVYLDDGQRQIPFEVVASFTLDETDYCWLKEAGGKDPLLFRFYPDGEDMVFESVEDEEEYEEAREAYLDLVRDREDQRESE